jgi:hypothetical protein
VWSLVEDYSASATYTWTPPLGSAGTYLVEVLVRSNGSPAAWDAFRVSGLFVMQ